MDQSDSKLVLSGPKLNLSLSWFPSSFKNPMLNPHLPFWKAHRVVGEFISPLEQLEKKVNRKHMGMVCEPSVCLHLKKKILKEEYVRLAKCLGCLKSSLWPLALDWRQLIGTKSSWHLGHEDDKKITWTIPMVQWEWIRRCFSICEGWWGWGLGQGSSMEVGLLEGSMRVWKWTSVGVMCLGSGWELPGLKSHCHSQVTLGKPLYHGVPQFFHL